MELFLYFVERHPEVEWEAIEGMRHVLVHGYYEITPDKVWAVISKNIPLLKSKIEEYLREEQITR